MATLHDILDATLAFFWRFWNIEITPLLRASNVRSDKLVLKGRPLFTLSIGLVYNQAHNISHTTTETNEMSMEYTAIGGLCCSVGLQNFYFVHCEQTTDSVFTPQPLITIHDTVCSTESR